MDTAGPRNATGDSFFAWDGDTLIVNILGKPAASKDAIGKPRGAQLKVSVTAAPKGGKATDHMLRFLAPLFGVPVSDISVVFGQENVNKQLRIKAPRMLPPVFEQAATAAASFPDPVPAHAAKPKASRIK
ncbi:MAG: DUF167 family protein [Rhodoferax sp.]|nr:DUF167 family protein [Rhodoferax sp.]